MPSGLLLSVISVFAFINQPSVAASVGVHHFGDVNHPFVEQILVLNQAAKDSSRLGGVIAQLQVRRDVELERGKVFLAWRDEFIGFPFFVYLAERNGRQFQHLSGVRLIRKGKPYYRAKGSAVVSESERIVFCLFGINRVHIRIYPCAFRVNQMLGLPIEGLKGQKSGNNACNANDTQKQIREVFRRNQAVEVRWRFLAIVIGFPWGLGLLWYVEFHYVNRVHVNRVYLWGLRGSGFFFVTLGVFAGGLPIYWDYDATYGCKKHSQSSEFHDITVTQKLLTFGDYCNTVIHMANVLNTDKQIAVISALAEGSSIRSIERITGVHRDTIMRLGVKVGEGCAAMMDAKMRDLDCNRLEMDEIWGFVGKKDRNVRFGDSSQVGSVWTFCAIDADTKLVPAFKVGNRDTATANAFVQDVANRMKNRVQISTDGLRAYVEAVEKSFGADVDFAQIVKTYGHEEISDNRRYSAPEFVSSEKKVITGNPNERLISTSYIERLNATTRLHMRRLTRLTLAFSKKRENFEAAVALHFAYYNFVKRHNTLRCTPAMAAGVEQSFLSVGDLVEAAA